MIRFKVLPPCLILSFLTISLAESCYYKKEFQSCSIKCRSCRKVRKLFCKALDNYISSKILHTIDCLNYLNWVVLVLQNHTSAVYIFSESGLSLIEKYYTKYLVFQQFSSNLYKSESRKNEFRLYCHRWCEKKVFPINNRFLSGNDYFRPRMMTMHGNYREKN